MFKPRLATVGLALTLAVGLSLAGCGSSSSSSETSSAASSAAAASPKDTLVKAVEELDKVSFDLTEKSAEENFKGTIDSANKAASISLTIAESVTMDFIIIGNEWWLKVGGEMATLMKLPADKWMHIDSSKIKDKSSFSDFGSEDPLDLKDLVKSANDVQKVDDTHYKGTVDLNKAGGLDQKEKDAVTAAGDKAKAVPFTAEVDAKGHLLSFKIEADAVSKDLSNEFVISNHGTAKVTKPADAIEAPESAYELLNN